MQERVAWEIRTLRATRWIEVQAAQLEQARADRPDLGVSQRGPLQAHAPQRVDQHVGERGQPQAQLVAAHGGRARPVGEERELLFFDAVLHVTAGAVELLVERGAGARSTPSEVTTKRGLAFPGRCSALPTTRRSRLHVLWVR